MKGDGMAEGILILVVLIVIIIITPKGDSNNPTNSLGSSNNQTTSSGRVATTPNPESVYRISLGVGNAKSAFQPYEEYITIRNSGRETVNITGWQLKNGKDRRTYDIGGQIRVFQSDTAIIPQATLFISPTGGNLFGNVLLESGETAIITTGSIGSQLPYKIVGFKENICSGYLENLPEYNFTPALTRNCPRPATEPGVNSLDTECRKFIERMSSCRTPEFETRDSEGEICRNCVDGKPLSNSCIAFIKSHFNYSSCIANHRNDASFSSRTWRIFLGRGWEMWEKEYEIIELFDQSGQLVDDYTY
jgi:hypothetical protein